jgi:hypothetical protein
MATGAQDLKGFSRKRASARLRVRIRLSIIVSLAQLMVESNQIVAHDRLQ